MRPGPASPGLRVRIAATAVLLAATGSCARTSTGVTAGIPAATVEVVPESAVVEIGRTLQLAATPKSAQGTVLHRAVAWSSSDPAVATVDAEGRVTGVSKGTTTITATSDGATGIATIRVIELGGYNCSLQSQVPEVECWALVSLYDGTNGPGWKLSTDWLSSWSPCDWYGVTCTDGVVTELALRSNRLTGPIPPELGALSNLYELNLPSNDLAGPIPPELGDLSNLELLELSWNHLTGQIPAELGNLSNLLELHVYLNHLTGPIPPELGSLSNLEDLILQENQLTGTIPPELGNLSKLKGLLLASNGLSGPIPAELGGLSDLRHLMLWSNQLTGQIPAALGSLSRIKVMFLSNNRLTGPLPAELGDLSELERLDLSGNGNPWNPTNQLTGPIPEKLGDLAALELLDLSGNVFTSPIPLHVAQRGGKLQETHGAGACVLRPPGNDDLSLPDTPEYRDADLDSDGLICGLGFTAVEYQERDDVSQIEEVQGHF